MEIGSDSDSGSKFKIINISCLGRAECSVVVQIGACYEQIHTIFAPLAPCTLHLSSPSPTTKVGDYNTWNGNVIRRWIFESKSGLH